LKEKLLILPFALFLFILPFPGTVSLRLLCLASAFLMALACYRRWAPPPLPCKPAILAWALVAGLSVAYSFDPAYSLGEFKNEIGYGLMAYWAFFLFAHSLRQLSTLLAALGAAVVVIAVWGVAGALHTGTWNEAGGHGGTGAASAFLAAVAPLFAVALLAPVKRPLRFALWVIVVLVALAAIATRQRILWPVFLLEGALGALLVYRAAIVRWSAGKALLGAGAAIAVAGLMLVGLQQWREQTQSTRPIDADARLSVWPRAAARIVASPWQGVGLGRQATRKAYPDLQDPQDPLMWHAHNVFLNAGISMGLPGVAALAFLFGSFLLQYARLVRAPERLTQLVGIAGILMVAGIIGRNLTNDFFVRDGSLLFWAANGALLGVGTRART
jgi:O-antigen ligase